MTLTAVQNRLAYNGRLAIDRSLFKWDGTIPRVAARARLALCPWLDNISQSKWPRVAWRFSRLTGDGFPLEWVFSSLDPSIRYTIEVSGPERHAAQRLSAACTQLTQLGIDGLQSLPLQSLIALQEKGPLRFGCWLGGRSSQEFDRYKLYVEVPEVIPPAEWMGLLAAEYEARFPAVWRLRMVGLDPAGQCTEFYFAGPEISAWEVTQLPRYAGLQAVSSELVDLIRHATGHEMPEKFPAGTAGWSLAFHSDGSCTYSFFCFARYLWNNDNALSAGLQRTAQSLSWDLSGYQQVASGLTRGHNLSRHFGMVSFVAAAGGRFGIGIGLRPPDPS